MRLIKFTAPKKAKGSLLGCLGDYLPFGQRTPDFSGPHVHYMHIPCEISTFEWLGQPFHKYFKDLIEVCV
jgi:hypothetical protein